MSIDPQKLAAILAQTNQAPPKFRLHLFDNVASTNTTLWQLLEKGAQPATVVIANTQTSGRGQWGRQWLSLEGGLYLSVALAPHIPATNSHQLTLCSAWGIARALKNHGVPVTIKWPNDLMLGDRKLGGILTETKIANEQITQAVVGVGINWTNPVPETGISLASYAVNQSEGAIASLEMLAAVTLVGIASGFQQINYKLTDS